MQLDLEWGTPIPLVDGQRDGLIYSLDLDAVDPDPGVYVFARRWGKTIEALYVGKSDNVQRRLRGQLNNLRLMRHVESAKAGRRVVIPAYALARSGQRMAKVLATLERALIRHFLAEGHDLVNQQGVRIRRHEIQSTGAPRGLVPSPMYLERARHG